MELEELIELYHIKKELLDTDKKEVDSLNKNIKKKLTEEGLDEYTGIEYTVSKTEINADKIDEDKLVIKLKELHPEVAGQVIKIKEYIDLDKLEDLIYNRVIEADVVNSCIVHKAPTIRLNIRKNKEETDDGKD